MARAGAVAGLAFGLMLGTGAAVAGEISTKDAGGQSLLAQRTTSLLAALKSATEKAESQGGENSEWLDTRNGQRNALSAWAQAALVISDLATLFGARGDTILTQTGPQGFYVGTMGTGGNWFGSASTAQSALMRLLLADNLLVPAAVREALASETAADIDTLARVATEALKQSGPIVATGSTVTFTLTSTRFSAAGTPTVYAPVGMRVARTERTAGNGLAITLDLRSSAKTGNVELRAFNPNTSFLAADTFNIYVIAGSGDVAPPADDHAATRSNATLLTETNDGEIAVAGDQDLFRADITARGTLTLTTSGPTDVVLTLEDAAGSPIASDDDGGGWYNARIVRALGPGTFYVRVRHAASGTGRYTLKSDFAPN